MVALEKVKWLKLLCKSVAETIPQRRKTDPPMKMTPLLKNHFQTAMDRMDLKELTVKKLSNCKCARTT